MFNVFSFIYDILATIFFIIFYPFVMLFRLHTGKDTGTRLTKLGFFSKPDLNNEVIMFHAVSVGEVVSLEKLLKRTKEKFPNLSIVVTTSTKTGQELAQKKYKDIADYITYFPFDIPFAINNFLNKINPTIVLIAETELWPDFAIQCKKKNIPLMIINGRISDSSYSSYKLLKPFFVPILKLYTNVYTQSNIDNERFISLGANKTNTEVMKNLKFEVDYVKSDIDLKKGNSRVLIAGSTHHGENEIILKTYNNLKQKFNDLKLIIAPRHMERLTEINNLLQNYNFKTGYRSKNDDFTQNDIILLDTLGELKKTYAICDIAFIGGSFNNTGGHNPLEATIYNVPTISGPSIKNFRDIYSILTNANASKIVKSQSEFENYLEKLLSDNDYHSKLVNNCKNIFESQQGAIDFVISKINNFINT